MGDLEAWRPIDGFDAVYEVSDLGRVRSRRGRHGVGCVLKPCRNRDGYLVVSLYSPGRREQVKVHQAVATAFLGPCPTGLHVHHRDSVKTNNLAANLQYVTPAENTRDAFRQGLIRAASGERHGSKTKPGSRARGEGVGTSKLSADRVREIRRLRGEGATRSDVARQFHVSEAAVRKISIGATWRHVQ